MSLQASLSVSFQADDAAAAQAVLDGLTLPPGASVSLSTSEVVSQGTVDDGGNVIPSPEIPAP